MPNPDRRMVLYNQRRAIRAGESPYQLRNWPRIGMNLVQNLASGQFNRPFLAIADRLYQNGKLAYSAYKQLREAERVLNANYEQVRPVLDVVKKGANRIKDSIASGYKALKRRRVTAPSLGFGSRRLNRFLILNRGRVNKRFRRYRRRW